MIGQTAEVYRSTRDKFGDKAETLVGSIDNVVLQWGTYGGLDFQPSNDFQETASLTTVAFVPKTTLRVESRDRIKIAGQTYQVIGERAWDYVHPMTGYDFGYYMVQVQAVV